MKAKSVRRRYARGFSLIELGIVIAVIAVLAAVVIFGRGFIAAGRITKAVELSNTIRKAASTYAGLVGGSLTAVQQNQIPLLAQRSLVPAPLTNPAGALLASGSEQNIADSIIVTDVRWGQVANQNGQPTNAVAIRYQTPTGNAAMAQDIWNAVFNDRNLIKTGAAVGGLTCASTAPTTNSVVICFFL